MNMRSLVFLVLLALTLGGCASAASRSEAPAFSQVDQGMDGSTGSAVGGAPAPAEAPGGNALPSLDSEARQIVGEQGTQPNQPNQPDGGRLVIRTASISLQVNKVRDAEASLRVMVDQMGGYIVKVETNGTDEYMTSLITFRVPAASFDKALTGTQALAEEVLSSTITGDDVTEEFVDLSARQRALEATRDRLLALLEQAENVEDALAVNQSLTDIQAQLEQIEGRKKFLTQSAALSTITAELRPVPAVAPIVEEDGWQPVAVARGALRELISLGQLLVSALIVVLVWTPAWLPFVGLVVWLRRRRRKARPEPVSPTA
ncbi:MAG TPA: DUF4349 domain-containing protein [Roseiflexaceae bacterium]|nr:DUF4349 domain-containing protein [Roseiflexaceae bacterium]